MSHEILHSFDELPDEPHVVTIGSFDGVHRGHQYLLRHVIEQASAHGASSLAVTFDPLPAEVLRPDKAPTRLCSTEERIRQIRNAGIDRVVVLQFTQALANQSADEFLDAVLQHARPPAIVIGSDFAFGHNRQGTPEFLAGRSERDGFDLQVVERVNPDGLELSSSAVRRALADAGDVQSARGILGRHFRLSGTVQNGDHRGRELGYPTANLDLPDRMTLPSDGIYAAFVELDESAGMDAHPALVYVGTRPTFGAHDRLVEVFLLDFDANLYGRRLSVDFIERIRGDREFASADQLVEQMQRDEDDGRRIFAELGIEIATS